MSLLLDKQGMRTLPIKDSFQSIYFFFSDILR